VSDKWYVHAAERRSAADDPAALHVRNFPDEDTAKRFTAQLLARKKKVISAGTVGFVGLVVGCSFLVNETRLALRSIYEEAALAKSWFK